MNKKEVLGVIGGAGVAATNKFSELLEIEATKQGAYRDAHHPEIIIYQATQVPSRSMFLEGKGEDFSGGYIEVGKKLKAGGATLLCMTCNTAHHAIGKIESGVGLPFINLIEEVVLEAKKYGKTKIGLMASDGSLKGEVYEKYMYKLLPDATIIYPDKRHQEELTRGIVNVKNKNRFKCVTDVDRPHFIFKNICLHLYNQGAELIIAGCTDIRVDFSPIDFQNIKIIDSLEVLCQALWRKLAP